MRVWDEPQDLLATLLRDNGSLDPENEARALLRRFGSVPGVLEANWLALWQASCRKTANAIKAADPRSRDALRRNIQSRPQFKTRQELFDFVSRCGPLGSSRRFIAIYVDSDLRLVRVEPVQNQIDIGIVDIGSVLARADAIGAFGIFIASLESDTLLAAQMTVRLVEGLADREILPLIAQVHIAEGGSLFVNAGSDKRALNHIREMANASLS